MVKQTSKLDQQTQYILRLAVPEIDNERVICGNLMELLR